MDDVAQAINDFSVLLGDQNSKLDAVLEVVGDMQKKVAVLPRIEQRMEVLEQDMKVVKAAVTATNQDLKKHKSMPTHVAHGRA
jgi:hypothetical protein